MVAIPLRSGAYSSASLIADAQRCINVFPEENPEKTAPNMPTTHYARPGLNVLSAPGPQGIGRCLYRSTRGSADPNGDLFAVVGSNVYFIDPNFQFNLLGHLLTPGTNPVSMTDNGTTLIIVDGTTRGYQITIADKAFSGVTDPNFLGGTRGDFLDSFMIFNVPNTNQWYCSMSDQAVFNSLFVGVKTAWPDNVLSVVSVEREAYIFGPQKSEVWFNAGAVPFPFQLLPGNIIEQGLQAAYSPAKMDTFVYWLSSSPEGGFMAMRSGSQNLAQRISNHAVEAEWKKYPKVDDAIGSVYQIGGHSFYRITFPTADNTWVYDAATEQWWEDNWLDTNGVFHRARNTFTAFAYGRNLGLDWNNGTLYEMTYNAKLDAGQPIPWVRSFPHIVNELKWVQHSMFMADVQTGDQPGTGETTQYLSPWSSGFSSGFGPVTAIPSPVVNLRVSKDGGNTFGKYRPQQNVSSGRYRPPMRWRGLGIARDAVFELSSTAQMCTALNGGYIDPIPAGA
jgi:hypothetical protein